MKIDKGICEGIRLANFCCMCAGQGEDGCPLKADARMGERRMRFDRRIWNRRATDANPVEARA